MSERREQDALGEIAGSDGDLASASARCFRRRAPVQPALVEA
jgi:hypothetical protein